MAYLNIIYFLILTAYGYRFLTSDGKVLKSASMEGAKFHYNGPELFWCLTFATGIVALSLDVGLDLMAIRLGVLELFCIYGMSISRNKVIFSGPLKFYLLYLIWLLVGCFYGPSLGYGFRVIMKYSYPLLLCLFASCAVRDSEVFLKSSLLARGVGVISVIFAFVPYIGRAVPGVFWYQTASAINYISLMIFSVGLFFFSKEKKKNLMYAIFFILPIFGWVLRTSLMGSVVALMAFSLIKWKAKSLPVIFGIFILGVAVIFTVPAFREKMFYDSNVTMQDFQQGKIEEDNINTNTRAVMWEGLEKRLYRGHEVAGSGTGSVQEYMYENEVFHGLKAAHSDFVQMKCDNGLIGLVLYCVVTFFIFAHCFKVYWSTEDQALKLCAIVAGASLVGVFATCYSDNTVNYSMATLSMPYGFYGMMLGMLQSQKS